MNINQIKEDLFNGNFDHIPLVDFYRFRIFLDSCLLLFNKEKLEKELKNSFEYKDFLNGLSDEKKEIIESCKNRLKIDHAFTNIEKIEGFYFPILPQEKITFYEQLRTIRKSFAHMQYGNFLSTDEKNGIIPYFGIYNKDKGIKKAQGIIIEPSLHYFIEAFFSNNIIKGIPYKHTYISYTSDEFAFYEVTYIGTDTSKYKGFGNHIMKNNIFTTSDMAKRKRFLFDHKNELKYNKLNISTEKIKAFQKFIQSDLNRKPRTEELGYIIKAFYDIETEFSNFLVHIIQLNDNIIDYKLNSIMNTQDNAKNKHYISSSIDELKEDIDSSLIFKYFFTLLECINLMLRLEDDDLSNIKKNLIKIHGFMYEPTDMVKYVNTAVIESRMSETDARFGDCIYVLERFRNSIAHGNIKLELDSNNNLQFCFNDNWNQRTEQLKILINDLKIFLSNNNWSYDK